jgi:hypothetical protein
VEFYKLREDEDGPYELEAYGEYTGNKKQHCLAELSFPKTNFDDEWFGVYELKFDARIYKTETDADFVQVAPTYTTQDFMPPIYDNAELLEEIEKINEIHTIEFMYKEFVFDMAVVDPNSAEQGMQTIMGSFFVSPDATAEQKVEIKMETRIPVSVA